MCGIAGFVGQGNGDILKEMTQTLKYRGPDSFGYYLKDYIGLGHRRLAIIDLSENANQPMSNSKGTVKIAFNGEIYNFKTLKNELKQKGYKFNSSSDTEVIIYLYEEYGEEFVSKLNGMFAIAIWDAEKQKMILARDRMGQKPLYYYFKNNNLIFASEIKAVLTHPEVDRALDEVSVFRYFAFDYVPQPGTIFKNIKKLENGCLLVLKENKINLKRYYAPKIEEKNVKEEEAAEELSSRIDSAVNLRLVSDVPLGVFLSGGIDSSVISYYAKKNKNDLKTFSIGFEEKSYDETESARIVADYLRTKHYHKTFRVKDLLDIIPKVFKKLDEPFGDASILPTYLLSEFAKQYVTVALAGDGGDELFCGYPNYKMQKLSKWPINKITLNKKVIDLLVSLLGFSEKDMALSFKIQRALFASQFSGLFRDFIVIGGYNNKFNSLFNFKIKNRECFNFVDKFLSDHKSNNYLEKIILLFQKYYLSDDILYKADRASMYNSLEVRAPFMDYNLVDYVNNLPNNLKLKGIGQSKYILKKIMENKLPNETLNKSKKGFGAPMGKWLNKDLREYMHSTLSRDNIEKIGIINYDTVKKLIDQHAKRKLDNKKILWNLIVFVNVYNNLRNR